MAICGCLSCEVATNRSSCLIFGPFSDVYGETWSRITFYSNSKIIELGLEVGWRVLSNKNISWYTNSGVFGFNRLEDNTIEKQSVQMDTDKP